ncbi:Male sterility, NAD-binding protein [Akanthomyces lecanii RCEF 1005]|uniref:Male sterility, NAD-binding protein n=1 Tax=Akanthomyces lecanii RCEF 1005 TaxID=1081108 RepID=A0A168G6F5_CORDF|nr:Male sterility, NAD-binding protein [Akanthomyces lecanii RCEF 1005]
MGAEWDPVDWEEDVYELVVKRKAQDPGVQAIFFTFPDAWTWRSRDLYKRHPRLPNHWEYFGRADDVIVFSNGEKLNPVTIEGLISGCEQVKGAIVAGQDKFQPLLILEVKEHPTTDVERDALLDSIWPLIEKANEITVAHGRIARWMMMIASPDTPFVRSPKGTVQRGATYKLLAEEIDSFYEDAGRALLDEQQIDLDVTNQDRLALLLVDLFRRESGIDEITQDTDVFTAGVDSLQVLGISTILKASAKTSGTDIDPDMLHARSIYNNPTPQLLAKYMIDTANIAGEGSSSATNGNVGMEGLVAKYTANLPTPAKNQTWTTAGEGQTVLLTGSTGSLGAYILDILCQSASVAKIFALNRGKDGGKSRQPGITTKYGLGSDFSKVFFVNVDLSQTQFGLPDDIFDELAQSADVIIHNAWPVNFNMSVVSFEPQIRGVRHLVDFSCAATKRVPIVFVSSVATVQNWTQPDLVPESRLEDLNLAQMGYGQSKLAASMILDAAAVTCGISVTNIRLGQVAGSKREVGLWNPQEYLPSLVASSIYMGIIPGDLGPQEELDWVAIEDVAGFITDIAGIRAEVSESSIPGYFNCVNPRTTTWQTLVPMIQEHYTDKIHKKVSFEEWVQALEQSAGRASDQVAELKENRGTKLVHTYRGFLEQKLSGRAQVKYSTSRGMAFSPTMAKMEPITSEMMKSWCVQWDRNAE